MPTFGTSLAAFSKAAWGQRRALVSGPFPSPLQLHGRPWERSGSLLHATY